MAGSGTNQKNRQAKMIVALLDPSHRTQEAACESVGIPPRTLQNWLAEPDFVAQLRKAEGDAIDESVRRLISVSAAADSVIVTIMSNRDNPPGVRLRAAGMVKESLVRLRELRNIEERLAALEAPDNGSDS